MAAVCDVDQFHREQAALDVLDRTGKTVQIYKDFRDLLDRPDIDAVVIAVPGPLACAAGDCRYGSRQGRVLRKAAVADRRRGAPIVTAGAPLRRCISDRQPAALRQLLLPPGARPGTPRSDRQADQGRRPHRRRSRRRLAARHHAAAKLGLELLARPRAVRRLRSQSLTLSVPLVLRLLRAAASRTMAHIRTISPSGSSVPMAQARPRSKGPALSRNGPSDVPVECHVQFTYGLHGNLPFVFTIGKISARRQRRDLRY